MSNAWPFSGCTCALCRREIVDAERIGSVGPRDAMEADPVWAALSNAEGRTRPLTDEMRKMLAEGRRAVAEGRFVPRSEIERALRGGS